jgi:hypothetical protein
MKKMNWFCENEFPFKWTYWMTLHATWIELNSNSIEKNLDANWHIKYWKFACVKISNIKQIFLEMVLKINKFTFFKIIIFYSSLLGNN